MTVDDRATATDGDYLPTSGSITFAADLPTLQTIVVLVNGDTKFEPNENFIVRLSNLNGDMAQIVRVDGIGTIFNDDPETTPWAEVPGDVVDADGGPDGDGLVLANDITVIRQFALGILSPVSDSQFRRADINGDCGDGVINAADVTIARLYNLGLLTPPTTCNSTKPALQSRAMVFPILPFRRTPSTLIATETPPVGMILFSRIGLLDF